MSADLLLECCRSVPAQAGVLVALAAMHSSCRAAVQRSRQQFDALVSAGTLKEGGGSTGRSAPSSSSYSHWHQEHKLAVSRAALQGMFGRKNARILADAAASSSSSAGSSSGSPAAESPLPSSILGPIRQACRRFASISLGARGHQRANLASQSLKERRARGSRLYRGVATVDGMPGAAASQVPVAPRRFTSSVRIDGHTHTLGAYASPEVAARAHDLALAVGS